MANGSTEDERELDEGQLDELGRPGQLDAGAFTPWLEAMQRAIRGEQPADVPCGTCTACCTSSQFVHIGPDEADALAHIPPALLFPAPRLPRGHVLLGYDERGHCPMLVDGRCSIYEHRPRTCRTYDCRVFPASGVTLDDEPEKTAIADRAGRWRFRHPAAGDGARHQAVRAAAAFLAEHGDRQPGAALPPGATPRAVLAVEIHEAFLDADGPAGVPAGVEPDLDLVDLAVERALRRGRSAGR